MRNLSGSSAWVRAGLVSLALLSSCKDGDDAKSTSEGTAPDTVGLGDAGSLTHDGSGFGASVDGKDEVAVPGTGTVALQVTPLSTTPDVVSLEADRVASLPAGSLAPPAGAELSQGPRVFSLLDGPAPTFYPGWIAAGAPQGLRLTVRKIMLMPKVVNGESQAAEVVFASEAGVQITIDSGAVDLSQLLAAASGEGDESAKFEVDEGAYDEVRITYARAGEVRGCVSAAFKDAATATRTFCTKAGKSVFETADAVDADFERTGDADPQGEWMKLDLDKAWVGEAGAADDYIIGYPLDTPLTVSEGATVPLSLVVDMNRLLRYHRGAPGAVAVGPGFPKHAAYFFTSLFAESVYVFAGRPGRIYGYEGVVETCLTETWNADGDPKSCGTPANTIAFWMTFVTDEDGKALLFNAMPDDDNAQSIVEGSSIGERPFLSPSSLGGVDVKFSVGDDAFGTLKNFPTSLDADGVGEVVDGVELEARGENGRTYHGMPVITRRL